MGGFVSGRPGGWIDGWVGVWVCIDYLEIDLCEARLEPSTRTGVQPGFRESDRNSGTMFH